MPYHLTKYENIIQSLLTFPERLMHHDEDAFLRVPPKTNFGSISVARRCVSKILPTILYVFGVHPWFWGARSAQKRNLEKVSFL